MHHRAGACFLSFSRRRDPGKRLCCAQAKSEPPWLEACPKDLGRWAELLDSIQGLALRSAALESLLEVRPGAQGCPLAQYVPSCPVVAHLPRQCPLAQSTAPASH